MSKKVSVIIPIGLNDQPREQLFHWVKKYYEIMFPHVELCIGALDEKPFSKGKAINEAVKKSTGEILVINDADVFFDPALLEESIEQLESHSWVIPYNEVLNISEKSTEDLLKLEPEWPIPIDLETRPRTHGARIKGGVNIIPRNHFEKVHGFDERFVGWGGEDDAFASALKHLCGPFKRLDGTIYHLWHSRKTNENYEANVELLRAYRAGKDSIIKEIEKRKAIDNN
ncbi:glycosyltransferase [Filobacillus milosensis]|uniref:Glycosyltransferase n=1 Tax=Filobacillus milosensis TaxID=94137 RepID=A0A4Y8IE60_9BACI|nr:galactosyltransferase-related protein [Filobacillus milosensis]TFB14288.1 glycosyltransferase [Filobacillus milosensis]